MPIDELSFKYTMYPVYRHQEEFYQAAQKNEESNLDEQVGTMLYITHCIDDEHLILQLQQMEDGVMVHGLFMEAMRWDNDSMNITDSLPGEMNPVSQHICSHDHMITLYNFSTAITGDAHGAKKKSCN